MKKCFFVIAFIFNVSYADNIFAQGEKVFIRERIETLASPFFHGRGYVMSGGERAATYIADEFREYGLRTLGQNGSFYQPYNFSINTFPGKVNLKINGYELKAGDDYIVHAASKAWNSHGPEKMKTYDLADVKDSSSWDDVKEWLHPDGVYLLKNADTPTKKLRLGIAKFGNELPQGLFIVPKHGKLTWTANQKCIPGTIVYVEDTVLPAKPKTVELELETKFIKSYEAKNVIGYVPGTKHPDSFIVFTAHYDHIGRMGMDALFAGANDNASGTSMVLYLANYFSKHPQPYSIAFMLFSGEEAGLLGSKHYVYHAMSPINKIRFLVNLDMTGDATNGITVVNGLAHKPEYNLMAKVNKQGKFLPKMKQRERTSNSDHYYFSKEGVPAFFIYGNGTKPHYHDVHDLPDEINLENVDGLARLLINFTAEITK